jgi:hypothetical protein
LRGTLSCDKLPSFLTQSVHTIYKKYFAIVQKGSEFELVSAQFIHRLLLMVYAFLKTPVQFHHVHVNPLCAFHVLDLIFNCALSSSKRNFKVFHSSPMEFAAFCIYG